MLGESSIIDMGAQSGYLCPDPTRYLSSFILRYQKLLIDGRSLSILYRSVLAQDLCYSRLSISGTVSVCKIAVQLRADSRLSESVLP